MRLIRRLYRSAALVLWCIYLGIISLPISRQKDRRKAIREMAEQTRLWGRGLLRIFGVKLHIDGHLEDYRRHGGLVVSNHLGYLDIFVHAACFGLRFTPKKDIRSWPLLGWYTDITIPIWIDRDSKAKTTGMLQEFRETLEDNIPLIVYPEGTSTDGKSGLRPFKAAPFEPIVGTSIPIQPVLTSYRVAPGEPTPCWYGDAELLPHLWSILGCPEIEAEVKILPSVHAEGRDRKQLASDLHNMMEKAYLEIRAGKTEEPEP